MPLVRACFWTLIRFLTGFRYRVRVEGLEELRDLRGPTLVMPNHPGLIDPPLVLANVRIPGGLRPIVTTSMYRKPVLYPLMRLSGAIEVPDLAEHSHGARRQTLTMIDAIAAGLDRGENFVIYPSGRTQRRGREEIGATRAVAELLQRCPQANIVLVRTRGIWGSIFSCAYTGEHPNLERCVVRAFGWVLAALFVFLPRRKVTMTVQRIDRRDLPGITRDKLNPFLEEWYNRGPAEKPTFVPFSFLFGPRQREFPVPAANGQVDPAKIRPATIRAVNEMVEERLKRPLSGEENSADALLERLGLDSLERMDLALHIEDRFGFRSDRVADTLGELWALAEGQLSAAAEKVASAPAAWQLPSSTEESPAVLGETLGEAFVRRAEASGRCRRRRRPLRRAQLSQAVRCRPADGEAIRPIARRRPAGSGACCNGRPPSRLGGGRYCLLRPAPGGRTAGAAELDDRSGEPGACGEDAGNPPRHHFQEADRPLGYPHRRRPVRLLGRHPRGDRQAGSGADDALDLAAAGPHAARRPRPDVDSPAVVLFTSGSESAPKAVPLTHRNLITNLRASLEVLQATHRDVLLGFLPPFHSFGLLANVLAPVLGGIRVAHYPDPTDAAGLVRTVAAYKATIVVATPTFLSYMFGAARPGELDSLRIIVSGAEKCPETLFQQARQIIPHAFILEGYGITECSPVVAGNLPQKIKQGTVGPPVTGVETCVVDPESHAPLPAGAVGMLLVRGPSIFHGYLNYDGPDPFTEVDGKRWYVTGDLVRLDEDRYIHFCGRLKRFLKIGGEMVSLPALEEPLARLYPPTEDSPQVAVEGVDLPERWIVLFTTREISLKEANDILAEAGFRGVMRLDAVQRVEKIPVLGTGKTDYKVLRKMLAEKSGSTA